MKNKIASSSSIVWCKIIRAGLGNRLLLWANARVFAHRHDLPMVTTNWSSFNFGPWFRREKSKRLYLNYFKQDSVASRLRVRLLSLFLKSAEAKGDDVRKQQRIYVFGGFKFWMHYFDEIREYRQFVRESFYNDLLQSHIKREVNDKKSPIISVHIRRGDFQELQAEQKFAARKSWCTRAPISYFIEVIYAVRKQFGYPVAVSVFSDGNREELAEVLELDNVVMQEGNKDIVDLLLMAQSKMIIPSPGSTFSLFASYLSDAIILHHPDFWMRPLRSEKINKRYYEGPAPLGSEEWPIELKHSVRDHIGKT